MKGKISEVYRRKFNQVLFSIEKLPKDSSVNKIKRPYSFIRIRSMRMEGLEPSRGHPRQILSLMRLPFRHIRVCVSQYNQYDNKRNKGCQQKNENFLKIQIST